MVDVGGKDDHRPKCAREGRGGLPGGELTSILAGGGPKGPIEEVARVAGILAAKDTGRLIPMCHPLGLDLVEIRFEDLGGDRLEVLCRASCSGRTGVEMEAMVGASVAALTVYDMTKALSKGIRIEGVELSRSPAARAEPGAAGDRLAPSRSPRWPFRRLRSPSPRHP